MATLIQNTVISLTAIDGIDCLGDSRPIINNNITTIGESISSLTLNTVRGLTGVSISSVNFSVNFNDSNSGKLYHFDTSTQSLCAIFAVNNLSDGFNVTITNTGTQNIVVSSNNLKSIGTTISEQYASGFIYKFGDSVFATGRLI